MADMHLLCPTDACRYRVADAHRGEPLRCPHCDSLLVEYTPSTPEPPLTPPERLGWVDFLGLLLLGVGVVYVVVRWLAWLLFGASLPP